MAKCDILFVFMYCCVGQSLISTVSASDNATTRDKYSGGSSENLIFQAESCFPKDVDLIGYDIYHQMLDWKNGITKYINKKYSNVFFERDQSDSMQKLVIIQKGEDGPIYRNDNQTFVVFRQTLSHIRHYTGHLAYIRSRRNHTFVEWDILPHDQYEMSEIFAATFTPNKHGLNFLAKDSKATESEREANNRKRNVPDQVKRDVKSFGEISKEEQIPENSANWIEKNKRSESRESVGSDTFQSKTKEDKVNTNASDDGKNGDGRQKMVISFDEKSKHPQFEDKASPYTGILDCDYENVGLKVGEYFEYKHDDKIKLVEFLLKTLRAQCYEKIRENTLNLFLEDFVWMRNDLRIHVNLGNNIYKEKCLHKTQWDQIISSVYLSIYSSAYRTQTDKLGEGESDDLSPDKIKISKSIRTLSAVMLRGVETIHELDIHAVKILKSLLSALNERYQFTLKKAEYLNARCKECYDELDTNLQDRIQLQALKEFVIFGVENAHGKKGPEMDKAFVEFYNRRLPFLTGQTA